jgi:phosphoglycerol transferase MdoB-like AlkP superfamily enzyme
MIVMVEAMGEPTDPMLRNRFDRIWQRRELADRFDVTHGKTAFYGSTTSGEMRELCQRWGDYDEITGPDTSCLPALLEKRGYQTTSYHAFTSDFFDRDRWYPLIGFQNRAFGQELLDQGASYCPNVFPGACDRDIPAIIAKQLKQAHGPQFVYWLTLNSHLPIVENHELGTENCSSVGSQRDADFPMICRLFAIWGSTADALVKVVKQPDFPPTHILIVGDHMPPFTHQKSRLQFDPAHVPWVLLRFKGAETSKTAPSLQSPRAR